MNGTPSPWRAALVNLALAGVAFAAALGTLELALRSVPALVPAGVFGAGRFSPEVGMNLHGGTMIYNKVRHVRRTPNPDGFMDVAHEHAKPAGVRRVGVFGDSYVEAMQVPLEQTFFRLVPQRIAGLEVETLAFGMSGWGTLHELVVWRVFGPRFDLDAVVYVFVENDPGDNDIRIQRHWSGGASPKPFAEVSDAPPGFELRWLRAPGELPLWLEAVKLVQRSSLLLQVAVSRVELLRQRGIQTRADARQAEMTTRTGDEVPDQNDAPSSWPPEHRAHAAELTKRILARWRDEVAGQGGRFFVLYVPRGETQLTGELALADTWRPWLGETCDALGIPLVDPTPELAARLAAGEHVYDDHWSPAGHEVIAGVLERAVASLLAN